MVWGGHRNGLIPTDLLEYVGDGLLSGQRQYLHPAAARAWRALVAAVKKRTGRELLLTEGYRTLALQEHYRRILKPGAAAVPGTSTHGWALAVDMGNYTSRELVAVRELAHSLGWSLETGRIWNEPWHLEYVGPLGISLAGDTTAIIPELEETDMRSIRQANTPNSGVIIRGDEPPVSLPDQVHAALVGAFGLETRELADWQYATVIREQWEAANRSARQNAQAVAVAVGAALKVDVDVDAIANAVVARLPKPPTSYTVTPN